RWSTGVPRTRSRDNFGRMQARAPARFAHDGYRQGYRPIRTLDQAQQSRRSVSDRRITAMFKNLHTATKLFILCGLFILALGVTTYQLRVEKKIALDLPRNELAGAKYLDTLRDVYVSALIAPPGNTSPGPPAKSRPQVLDALAAAEATAGRSMHTAELATAL